MPGKAFEKKVGLSNVKYYPSNVKNKKYRVEFEYKGKNYKVNFGDKRYEHFKDSTPLKLYKDQDHKDKERRKKYLSRAYGITNKQGEQTANDPTTANFWSIHYLW